MDFHNIDAFITGLAALLEKHKNFLLIIVAFSLFAAVALGGIISGSIAERRKRKDKEQRLNAGDDTLRDDSGRSGNTRARRLTEAERQHLELLSQYIECATAIKDDSVSRIVFDLAGTMNRIFRKVLETKKINSPVQTFIEHHAPETLRLAQEYQRLSESAATGVLRQELAKTAQTLATLNQDFVLYLAECEKDEAAALEILRRTREVIASMDRPSISPMLALPQAKKDIFTLETQKEEKVKVPRI